MIFLLLILLAAVVVIVRQAIVIKALSASIRSVCDDRQDLIDRFCYPEVERAK